MQPSGECVVFLGKTHCKDETEVTGHCSSSHCGEHRVEYITSARDLAHVYIVCSIVLSLFIPFCGIPALIFSIRSYQALPSGPMHVARLAKIAMIFIILGSVCLCAAIPAGCLAAAYLHHNLDYPEIRGVPVRDSVEAQSPRESQRYEKSSGPITTHPTSSIRNSNILNNWGQDFIKKNHNKKILQEGGYGQSAKQDKQAWVISREGTTSELKGQNRTELNEQERVDSSDRRKSLNS